MKDSLTREQMSVRVPCQYSQWSITHTTAPRASLLHLFSSLSSKVSIPVSSRVMTLFVARHELTSKHVIGCLNIYNCSQTAEKSRDLTLPPETCSPHTPPMFTYQRCKNKKRLIPFQDILKPLRIH